MDDKSEHSNTPTGDAAEEFLRSKKGSETKPNRLQQEVLNLYRRADEVKQILQTAVAQRNPVLSDYSKLKRWGIDLHFILQAHEQALAEIEEGRFNMTFWIGDRRVREYIDPAQPRISLEGQEVLGIALEHGSIGFKIDKDERFGVGHTYCLILQARDPKNPEDGSLFHSFSFSDKGNFLRERDTEPPSGESEQTSEMEPHVLEITGVALNVLKKHLKRALNSTTSNL